MDLFDTAILNLLRDEKPREFREILTAVKFSHNTLRQHLDSLLSQSLITKDKRPMKGRGRPKYASSVAAGKGRAQAVIPNPSTGVVSLSFGRLSQICRFEKGGFCKKVRGQCNARICLQIK
jgi:DNA-binding transcriptional ArsR family regulator